MMIASVYPITAFTSLDRWRDFILRDAGIRLQLIQAGINANKENHPGKNGNSDEDGHPENMEQKPTGADDSNRREDDRPRLTPPGFVLPDGGLRG
jgi:hypothetical protein